MKYLHLTAAVRATCLCMLLLSTPACRNAAAPDECRQKISSRLLNELSEAGVKGRKYRVVIKLLDSTGIVETVPSVNVASRAAATGLLTADEIRRLCVLNQVQFIDLPKLYRKLEQE